MEGLEMICFQMISAAGGARSCFIEAIQEAKAGNLEEARKMMEEGHTLFRDGHKAHASLIAKEADGKGEVPTLLLVHAEDQMMSAEMYEVLANEWIDLYEQLHSKKENAQVHSARR